MKNGYLHSTMSLNRLNNSLLDYFLITGFNEDTGLKPIQNYLSASNKPNDFFNTAFEPQIIAILSWEGTTYPISGFCKENNVQLINTNKPNENSLKIPTSPLFDEGIKSILPFCFPDYALAYEIQPPEKIHFLVLTNIAGFYSFAACFTYYKKFNVEIQITTNEFNAHRIHRNWNYKDLNKKDRIGCYLPVCCVFVSKFPYYTIMRNCLAWAAQEITRDPDKMMPILEELVHQLYLVPVPPPGPVTISYKLHSLPLTIKGPYSPDNVLVDFNLGIILIYFQLQDIFKIFNCLLTQQKLVFLSSNYALLTIIVEGFRTLLHPFKWPYIYIPILASSLMDFLDAPGSYIMGVDVSFEDKVDEIDGLVVANINQGTVSYTRGVLVPTMPDVALKKAITDISLIDLKENSNDIINERLLSDDGKYVTRHYQENINQQIQKVFLGLLMDLFGDVTINLNLHRQLFDQESFLSLKPLTDRQFYKEVIKGQMFNNYLRELTDQKTDICKLYKESHPADASKTLPPGEDNHFVVQRHNAFHKKHQKKPVFSNSFSNLRESCDVTVELPMFHKNGEQLYMSRCIAVISQKLQDSKSASLRAVYLYLRGMFYVANNQAAKGFEDFQTLTAHDIRLFPADTIGGILVSFHAKDSSHSHKKSLLRKVENWRKLVDRTSVIIENNIVGPENMPTRPLDYDLFSRYLQRLCVANDPDLIERLFQLLSDGKSSHVNAEMFKIFYKSWNEVRQQCHPMEELYKHLDEDETFLTKSSKVKSDLGSGKLILTDRRILFHLSDENSFKDVIRLRHIKRLEKFRIVKLSSISNALRIISAVNHVKPFTVTLRKERKLWYLIIKEMSAGKKLSEQHRDPDYITQASKHVLLLATLDKCIENDSIKTLPPIKKIAAILFKFIEETEPLDRRLSIEELGDHPNNLIQKLDPNQKEPERHTVESVLYVPGNYDDEDRIPPRFWCALGNGKVKVFNASTWVCEPRFIQAKQRVSSLVAIGSQEVWAGSEDTSIYIIDSESITSHKQLILHTDVVIDLTCNHEQGVIYSASVHGHIIKWNIESRHRIDQHHFENTTVIVALKYMNTRLWCCTKEQLIVLDDRFKILHILPAENTCFKNFLVTPKNQLWICCTSGLIKVWDVENYTKKNDIQHCISTDFVQAVYISGQIWAGNKNGKIIIYDAEEEKYLKTLDAHQDVVRSMICVENRYIISGSGSKDGRIAMWRPIIDE